MNNYDDERQFHLTDFLSDQFFGPGGGQFPGGGATGGQFPGGGNFPGGAFPGGGFPGGPGGPGGPFPGFPDGGQSTGAPTTPPPNFTPQQQFQTKAIDPGGIRGCLFRFTYIWLRRDSFWFFPTFVGRNSVAGFRWSGFRWVYFGIDLDRIESFQCY